MVLLGTSLLLLTGCSDLVDQDQVSVHPDAYIVLEPGRTAGQTFVAQHGGLNGVEFWLEVEPGTAGRLLFHLRADPQSSTDLAQAVLPLEQVTGPGFYRFVFSPDNDSHSVYYYAFLEMEGTGSVQVGAASGEAYLNGAAYQDHEPLDAQLAFRLVYYPPGVALELIQAALKGLRLLAVAALLYLVPGYALLAWLWREGAPTGTTLPWPARMGLAAGVSLAVYPLLLLWTDLVGLHLGPLYAWLPVVGGLAALAWRHRHWRPRVGWEALQQWARSDAFWPDLTLLVILALVFGVRLLVVRTLDAPMWGDSYQHTMIVQLIVDHGGLFDSWEPYAELQTFTYHFGFHATAAALHWITGMGALKAVLFGGQVLNGLAAVALYPLAVRVGGRRWAGVGAVLTAGLLLPMPMFYVNWGRYTQLAGQAILPAAVVLSWVSFETPRWDWKLAALVWVVVGGLALTHYRVLIFYTLFVAAWIGICLRRRGWYHSLLRASGAGSGAAVLFLPWFSHIFLGRIPQNFTRQITTPPNRLTSFAHQYNAIGDIARFMPPVGWLFLAVAIAAGLWRRQRSVLLVSLWWFLLLIVTNPNWFHLPGSGAISNFALFIAVYIPAGVLMGWLLGEIMAQWTMRKWVRSLAVVLLVGTGLAGTLRRMEDLQADRHAMVTRPDLRAMAWIRENTPEDARFLVNSFFAYGGSVIVGSDGGWWLPLLAGRANTVPPLNYGTEQGLWDSYRQWVNEVRAQIEEAGIDHPETLAMLRERGITYVYIGQQRGRVNYRGEDVLDPSVLAKSGHFQPIYHKDLVWVFGVKDTAR